MYYSQKVFDEYVKTIHHIEKNYKCELCKKYFSQWSGLNWHLKSKAHFALSELTAI